MTVSFEIKSLGDCDRLDSNYTAMKANHINNETKEKVVTIQVELVKKLKELEKEKAIVFRTATSFTWVALMMIVILFSIIFLTDIMKLINYLNKIKSRNTAIVNTTPSIKNLNNNDVKRSVFQLVTEREKDLFDRVRSFRNQKIKYLLKQEK